MRLQGKTAIVTGGGSGIGLAVARGLAAEGCRTLIAGRDEQKLRAAATATGQPELLYHRVDVADRESVLALFKHAESVLPQIDFLVNSAGVNIKLRTMEEMPPEQWDYVMGANATGVYNCMYAVLPQMRRRGEGLIINVSSISGKRASALGGVAYVASKFAMAGLGTAVANEEANRGIRVTSVYPGEVNTPILEHRPQPVSEDHKAAILQPEDVAVMIVAIAALPAHVHVPELIIKPTWQGYV